MDAISIWRFLQGRLLGLAASMGFQILIVRWLAPVEYARYALVLAVAAVLQTATSLGLPRVASKFLSGAGSALSPPVAKTLILRMLGLRAVALIATLILAALAAPSIHPQIATGPLLLAGGAYALATTLQGDSDGIALALGLQSSSRRAIVGEPVARLLILALATLGPGGHAAVAVLWISAATAAVAGAALVGSALAALKPSASTVAEPEGLDWREVRRVALAGYGGALSWLALSPAVIRLIASRVLPLDAFAGFSFVQALTLSAQRYAPSFTLFPLIEPAVMADAARTGRADGLNVVLTRLVALDAVIIGAAIVGLACAGAPIVSLLTHSRYGGAAVFLPWLLAIIVANASHRRYEIAAIALGVGETLIWSLGFTIAWLGAMLVTTPLFGVWPLLLCPLGDAITRYGFMQRRLAPCGGAAADLGTMALIAGSTGVAAWLGALAASALHADVTGRVLIGGAAVLLFLGWMTFCGRSQLRAQWPSVLALRSLAKANA